MGIASNSACSTVLKFSYQDELEQSLQQRLYESATRDQLVGVHNRQFFLDSLQATFAHATRKKLPLSLLMLDIDHFKNVNDTHGHLAGDHVLREIARIIKQAIRTEDIFARFGGEEFVLLLAESDPESARHAAERIRKAVEAQVFEYEGRPIRTTLPVGLTTYQARNYPSPHSLIAASDAALYEAKRRPQLHGLDRSTAGAGARNRSAAHTALGSRSGRPARGEVTPRPGRAADICSRRGVPRA